MSGLLDFDPKRFRDRNRTTEQEYRAGQRATGFDFKPELTEQQKAILGRNISGMTPEPIKFPIFMFGRWLNEDQYRAMQQRMGSQFNRGRITRSEITTGEYDSLRKRLGL
jgi:hypothetical protein